MVFFRLLYIYVLAHDTIRMAPPRRAQSANASCTPLVSALQVLTRAETCDIVPLRCLAKYSALGLNRALHRIPLDLSLSSHYIS